MKKMKYFVFLFLTQLNILTNICQQLCFALGHQRQAFVKMARPKNRALQSHWENSRKFKLKHETNCLNFNTKQCNQERLLIFFFIKNLQFAKSKLLGMVKMYEKSLGVTGKCRDYVLNSINRSKQEVT